MQDVDLWRSCGSITERMQEQLKDILWKNEGEQVNLLQEIQMVLHCAEVHFDDSLNILMHSHNFYEILFCSKGNVQYLVAGKRYQIRRGDVVIIPPGANHRPICPSEETNSYERIAIWINPEVIKNLSAMMPDVDEVFRQCERSGEYRIRSDERTSSRLLREAEELLQEGKAFRPGWEGMLYSGAIQMMIELARINSRLPSESKEAQDDLLDGILSYVDTSISEPITLMSTAEKFSASESTIVRIFRQKLGVSFYQYVIQRRLNMAKTLLLSGSRPQEVYEKCGFPDYTCFYRAFRKEYCISPKAYVKIYYSAIEYNP